MSKLRSRFSRRHLLALCTFLVPLAVLAVLGQSELQRQGDRIEAGIGKQAKLFLNGAAQALEQQIEGQLSVLVDKSLGLSGGVVRTTLRMREEGHAALLDILVLDEQNALLWPSPPLNTLSLPFAHDPRGQTMPSQGLAAADLLICTGNFETACALLQQLIGKMEITEVRSIDLMPRFRLATVHRHLGHLDAARADFERVRNAVFPGNNRVMTRDSEIGAIGMLAEAMLAEMGSPADRVALLEQIASSLAAERKYIYVADSLLTAVYERIVASIADDDPVRRTALALLGEERQRAQTRAFAGDYDSILKGELRMRTLRLAATDPLPSEVQMVVTLGTATTMLSVRDATPAEREQFRGAARVMLHVDLGLLMAPALEPSFAADSQFVLAVADPLGFILVDAPSAVPANYVPPSVDVRGITLSAYPANAERLLADAGAQARNRVILLVALVLAAMAGALWLWRSVSREADLATLKIELVSRVSHELKTPLALIRMYGETLQLGRARDADQAKHFGAIIARESERLTTMIQRILDFSRQQAGTLDYSPTQVDFTELLRRLCEAYTPHLEARGAILIDTIRPDIEVACDENACEGAVINLLENATKYAIEGDDEHEIEVDLATRPGLAILEVRDRGRGVPPSECDAIFDPFYRATNSGEVRGAGIGLSLVRHFARAHGGDITATPREGGGAVFRLTLPISPPKAPRTATNNPS